MKPRNKFEREVLALSQHLPSVTREQEAWAFRECIDHYAYVMAEGKATCMDCGHVWQIEAESTDKHIQCPHCGAWLEIERTAKRGYRDKHYYTILTTMGEYQVLRMFRMDATMKKGERAEYHSREIGQHWWNADGGHTINALRRCMGCYADSFAWDGFGIREDNAGVYHYVAGAPTYMEEVIPTLVRNGWREEALDYHVGDIIDLLLTDPKAETLWKAGQYSLVGWMRHHSIEPYWASVKIAMRNGYMIEDASTWIDMIKTLEALGRDTHNAHYVCPENLQEAHDRVMGQYRRMQTEEKHKAEWLNILNAEKKYKEMKGRFFGIAFSDGMIDIHVLDSVQKIADEGHAMHHCVYACGYYKKSTSLILGATIGGQRIETIEVSLKTFEVVQSRGVCNSITEHHDAILRLMEANMDKIRAVA